jgi:tRNA(adenine34) deaminase
MSDDRAARGRATSGARGAAARRAFALRLVAAGAWLAGARTIRAAGLPAAGAATADAAPDRRWIDAAFAMKRLAESWGDQPYGAVVVTAGALAGEGPSRVVKLGDPDAHAEREAIRDAQRRLGRRDLAGAVLYSTSPPCARCRQVAADAGIVRMIHGADMREIAPGS